MPNFNGNNIGFTKFCQENVKKSCKNIFVPWFFFTGPYCLVPSRRSFVSDKNKNKIVLLPIKGPQGANNLIQDVRRFNYLKFTN